MSDNMKMIEQFIEEHFYGRVAEENKSDNKDMNDKLIEIEHANDNTETETEKK